MILIGENIHIISKKVKEALENRDENFVKNLIKIQENLDCIDLNIGPAKGKLDNIFEWLCPLTENKNISFDSTNMDAINQGLKLVKNTKNCFINSTSADSEKLEKLTDLALEYDCNLIALSMSKETGIPKTADERMEIIFQIYERAMEKGIKSEKLFFDPLVLPLKVDQTQGLEAINTIKMVKESFDPPVKTVIGLSNISNGCSVENRAAINQIFAALAFGAGLDAAIIDGKDKELIRIINCIETNSPQNETDNLYIELANTIRDFGDIQNIKIDKNNTKQKNIIKIANMLLNNEIYSDSFAQV